MSNNERRGRVSADGPAVQVQSVHRALSILDLLARHRELGVTQIADDLGVHKSTASRLLAVLEQHRLVEQLAERGKYRLGFGIVRLAGATMARLDLAREGRPVCRRLAARLGETINVAVRDTGAAMNIIQEQGSATVSVQNWIGQRTPLHATSSGKVLLAWAPDEEVTTLLNGTLVALTPHTITSPAALRADIQRVRERGWACTSDELEIGLNAVAVPIRDADGCVIGAVSVSGPAYRLTVETFPQTAMLLGAAAEEISAQIGYLPTT